jgi:hypothetical protein
MVRKNVKIADFSSKKYQLCLMDISVPVMEEAFRRFRVNSHQPANYLSESFAEDYCNGTLACNMRW